MGRKNKDLPGIEGPGVGAQEPIAAIDKAAEEYVVLRDRRMLETKGEVVAKAKVTALMKEHQLTRYVFDDQVVELIPGEERLKVRKAKDEDTDGDDE